MNAMTSCPSRLTSDKPRCAATLFGALLAASLLLSGPVTAKEKEKEPVVESHRFFAFDQAPYYTSPDQRIGAKLLIDSSKVGPTLATLQHLTFLPGAHIKSHRHVYVTEVIYVLKGNLTLRIDKETKVMGPDAVAYIPPQTFHEYLNGSSDVCQFLQYYAPPGPEEEYRNWVKPGDEKKTASASAKVDATPKEIVRPPLPMIPGSPIPRLDQPREVTNSTELKLKTESVATGSTGLQFRSQPPAAAPRTVSSHPPQPAKKTK